MAIVDFESGVYKSARKAIRHPFICVKRLIKEQATKTIYILI